jgi:hypothetical protein
MRICVNEGKLYSLIEKSLSHRTFFRFLALTAGLCAIFHALVIAAGHSTIFYSPIIAAGPNTIFHALVIAAGDVSAGARHQR